MKEGWFIDKDGVRKSQCMQYEDGKQKLYVNRGFGFLGYPGRVGIMAEITVIELV